MNAPLPQDDLEAILHRTRSLWEQMRGEQLFITGCTGFFGSWLLESFLYANRELSLGASVVGLTRSPQAFQAKAPHLAADAALTLLQGDIRNFNYPDGNFRFVIHAATDTSLQAARDPEMLRSSIIEGTHRVLNFAETSETRRFLLISSGAVYGPQPPDMSHITESYAASSDLAETISTYGQSKLAAESITSEIAGSAGIEFMIARCFAFVGPHLPLDQQYAIGNFIRDATRGSTICINGDGTPLRSYLYASDLAIWLWTLLFAARTGEIFNVGSDQALSIAALARNVIEALNVISKLEIGVRVDPLKPPVQYVPDIKKAREHLGLEVTVDLHTAIRKTAAWHNVAGDSKS